MLTKPMMMATNSSDEMGINRDIWTTWFNVDNPWTGDGDLETVSSIEKHYGKVCEPDYKIVHAECRVRGGDDVFDIDTPKDSITDVLASYCTTDGLICRNEDQEPTGKICEDYSVRFRCRYTGDDDDSFFPQFDVRIYIILAVVPILIFLIRILWAYIFRRRRQRRREQRRARRRANRGSNGDDDDDDDSSSIASGLANPPPSYHELFGEPANFGARSSIFAISRDNVPVCSKCQSKPCSVARIVSKGQSLSGDSATPEETDTRIHNSVGSEDNSSTVQQRTSIETNSGVPLQQLGGNDSGVSQSEININDSQSSPSEQSTLTSSVSSAGVLDNLSEVDLSDPTPTTDTSVVPPANSSQSMHIENEDSSQGGGVSADSDHLQSLDTTNSHALSPLTLSVDMSLAQSKSSISQPCACTCHRTVPFRHEGVEGYENPGYTSDVDDIDSNVRPHFPGMHVPVPGLPRVWSNLSNSSVVTLSELPSYEDALELMKKKKKEAESLQNSK